MMNVIQMRLTFRTHPSGKMRQAIGLVSTVSMEVMATRIKVQIGTILTTTTKDSSLATSLETVIGKGMCLCTLPKQTRYVLMMNLW